MAHVDRAFVQKVFNIPKRKRKTDIQHHRQADDLGAGLKVFKGDRLGHSQTLATDLPRSSKVNLTRPFRMLRLADVRRDLFAAKAGKATVTEISQNHGFTNTGRFASE
ncbi:hypothetical protein [Ruegeria sp. SCP11]|uniref:hypothetical protein n=1 Tax=Ruegeria sp. SCP11 TaxID=3141378 RepID=UPI00333D6FCB